MEDMNLLAFFDELESIEKTAVSEKWISKMIRSAGKNKNIPKAKFQDFVSRQRMRAEWNYQKAKRSGKSGDMESKTLDKYFNRQFANEEGWKALLRRHKSK